MKDEYLKRLEELLNENNIPNKEEVLEKYKKRYDFGLESEMTEDEIEAMLGSPDDIINRLKTIDEDTTLNRIISIKTVSDDVSFEESKDDKAHIRLYEVDQNAYNIAVNQSEIKVEYKSSMYLGLNRRKSGEIVIAIPAGRCYNKITIETATGDVEANIELNATDFSINTVSGDVDLTKISTRQTKVNAVSGDIHIDYLKCERMTVNTVSGDLRIKKLECEKLVLDSVSGDADIDDADVKQTVTNFISGDCIINGDKKNNFKDSFNCGSKKNK